METHNHLGETYLRQLTFPPTPEVDLVAVHGLNPRNIPNHGEKTWTAGKKGDERLWLRDFLPKQLPAVRVFLFGYNSNAAFNTTTTGVTEAAEDLLNRLRSERKAIVKARLISKYSSISRSTRGFAFFATPHQGGNFATLGDPLANIFKAVLGNVPNDFMKALRRDSLISRDFNNDFVDQGRNYRIWSFYETQSSIETRVPVNATHSTICKFPTEDENYKLVISNISDLVEWAMKSSEAPRISVPGRKGFSRGASSVSSGSDDSSSDNGPLAARRKLSSISLIKDDAPSKSWSTTLSKWSKRGWVREKRGPVFLVPYTLSPSFTGREDVLHHLKRAFKDGNETQTRFALYGLGGVGKSQIAVAFAHWYRINFPAHSVYWVHASSTERLYQSLVDIALQQKLLGIEDPRANHLDIVKNWLEDKDNGNWIMIIDNANNIDTLQQALEPTLSKSKASSSLAFTGLAHYIPECIHGQLLYTTNNRTAGIVLTHQGLLHEVRAMSPQESRAMLRKLLAQDGRSVLDSEHFDRKSEELDRLSTHLDHLPLALVQAASLIRESYMDVDQYLHQLEEDSSALTNLLYRQIEQLEGKMDLSNAVAGTWKLCFEQIQSQNTPAAEILSIMAFLDPQGVPKPLLNHKNIPWLTLTTALGILQAYSLISTGSASETYDMHRLVHITTRKWLETSGQHKKWSVRALTMLSINFPNGDYHSWQTCALFLPHALKVIRCELHGVEEAILLGTLQFKVARYYYKQGLFFDAKELNLQAIQRLERSFGSLHEQTLAAKSNHVAVLRKLGEFQEAEQLGLEVMKNQRRTLGANHPQSLTSGYLLSQVYRNQGKHNEAVKECRKSLAIMSEFPDSNQRYIGSTKVMLAANLEDLGKYAEAESLDYEGVHLLTTELGPTHPKTLEAQIRLSSVLRQQGKYEEATAIILRTWKVQEEVLGTNHPDTVKSRWNLALNLHAQSKYSEAEHHLREICYLAEQVLGRKHPETLTAISSLAVTLCAQGNYPEAIEMHRSVLARRIAHLRPDHPSTLGSRTDLALALIGAGDPLKAESMEQETLERLKRSVGKSDIHALRSRENLARALWAQKDDKAKAKLAKVQARKTLKGREEVLGWENPATWAAAELVAEIVGWGEERWGLVDRVERERERRKEGCNVSVREVEEGDEKSLKGKLE
ncbi:MAG: hypothetical protein Q9187_005152 [Circinaria calcarea]